MALYHKWDVKNDFAYVLQFFSLISDSLGSVNTLLSLIRIFTNQSLGLNQRAAFLFVSHFYARYERFT